MSKINSFLKAKKSVKKNAVKETSADTIAPTEPAVEPKEEWVKDVVDVEIVPVSVRKVDGASDFEDEEIDLPSSMVKTNFEWKKAEDEAAAAAAAAKEAQTAKPTGLENIFVLKKRTKPVEEMPTLDASRELAHPVGGSAEPTPSAAPVEVEEVKKETRPKKQQFVLTRKVDDDKQTCLTSADIWSVIQPWPRMTFLNPIA